MSCIRIVRVTRLAIVVLVALTIPSICAAQSKVEIGAPLVGLTSSLGDYKQTVFGVPSSGFGLLNPGLYCSLFLGSSLAIEPQVGLIWVTSDGDSQHFIHFAAQFDYFMRGTARPSPYVFGSAGVIKTSDSGTSLGSVSGGVGYRIPVGNSLALRFAGRLTHLTKGGGNTVTLDVSIGGLFGRR